MRNSALIFLALLVAPALASQAAGSLPGPQHAVEATTRSISLPANDRGVIVTKPCPACGPVVLRMTPATTYRVGNSVVSFPQLQKFISTGGERNLVVQFDTREHTITRIVITGQPTQARR
ncbi:MAG TPA: hypothetical protein VE046_00485 [Steroidobacteraceae bacterium]|nr:hypothetical protein [Steroidobacteraceae bacterium]